MTRSRKQNGTAGTVVFVGAGPGDPGMLTARATAALASADTVLVDPDVPPAIAEAVRADRPELEFTPAIGEPAEVAKAAVAAARSGGTVVRLVAGDPFTSDCVVKEVLAVGRTAVGFDVVPGVASTTGGSGTGQKSVVARLAAVAEKTAGLDAVSGPVVVTVGSAVDKRARLSWWESRPLFGWRVLVPPTQDQAGGMSDRLRAHGAVPVEVPTIAVEPPRSPAQMDRAVKGLVTGRYGRIVFTSVNAVKAVREKFAELGLDARAFAGVKVACVGESTAG